MKQPPTPTRSGDWRVINGRLVDFSQAPAEPAATVAAAPEPPAPQPAARPRRTRKSKPRS